MTWKLIAVFIFGFGLGATAVVTWASRILKEAAEAYEGANQLLDDLKERLEGKKECG